MYLSLPLKRALLIAGIGLVAVIVGVALTNRSDSPTAPAAQQPMLAGNPEPVETNPSAASPTPTVYATSPFGAAVPVAQAAPAPIMEPAMKPAPAASYLATTAPSAYVAPAPRRVYYARPRPVYRRYYYRPRTRVVVRRRPWTHSAAIVGGSAAGGAAIGALAGGGKGALAGGLVGGVGGLVYDRVTHKKRVVTRY